MRVNGSGQLFSLLRTGNHYCSKKSNSIVRLTILPSSLCLTKWSGVFFLILFKFCSTLVIFFPFKVKMDEIHRAVWNEMKIKQYLLFIDCLISKISFDVCFKVSLSWQIWQSILKHLLWRHDNLMAAILRCSTVIKGKPLVETFESLSKSIKDCLLISKAFSELHQKVIMSSKKVL